MEKIVVSFDSVLWNNYTGEYGNVKEYLQTLFNLKDGDLLLFYLLL